MMNNTKMTTLVKARSSLSRQLLESLESDFSLDRWEVGNKIPTEAELCKEHGVSRVTVRRALDELERGGVIDRIQGKGTFLRRKPAKKAEVSSSRIAYMVPCVVTNPSVNWFMHDFGRVCGDQGYEAFMCSTGLTIESEREQIARLHSSNGSTFCGACISPHWGFDNIEHFFELKRAGFPFVLIDLYFRELETDYVAFDHEDIGLQLTRHLITLGHKEIGFMKSLPCSAIEERHDGYMKALEEADLAYFPSLVREIDKTQESTSIRNGYNLAVALMKGTRKPTAIVTEGDLAAVGVILAMKEMGYRVPDDVAVVGSGDVYQDGESCMPLTTVRLPYAEAAQQVLAILLHRMQEPEAPTQRVKLAGELVVRESTVGKENRD